MNPVGFQMKMLNKIIQRMLVKKADTVMLKMIVYGWSIVLIRIINFVIYYFISNGVIEDFTKTNSTIK